MPAKSSRAQPKGSAMAPVEVACGQFHLETRPLSFTKADKDRIVQSFPEKITVSVPGFGTQELALRPLVKSMLDQVQPPAVKIAIAVRGEPDDVDTDRDRRRPVQGGGNDGRQLQGRRHRDRLHLRCRHPARRHHRRALHLRGRRRGAAPVAHLHLHLGHRDFASIPASPASTRSKSSRSRWARPASARTAPSRSRTTGLFDPDRRR